MQTAWRQVRHCQTGPRFSSSCGMQRFPPATSTKLDTKYEVLCCCLTPVGWDFDGPRLPRGGLIRSICHQRTRQLSDSIHFRGTSGSHFFHLPGSLCLSAIPSPPPSGPISRSISQNSGHISVKKCMCSAYALNTFHLSHFLLVVLHSRSVVGFWASRTCRNCYFWAPLCAPNFRGTLCNPHASFLPRSACLAPSSGAGAPSGGPAGYSTSNSLYLSGAASLHHSLLS